MRRQRREPSATVPFALLIITASLIFAASPLQATPGIVLDGSFGASGALAGPNYLIPASDGRQVGSNLFQSFSQFNLLSTESATFTGTGATGPISNILARVTGGSPSSIDGTLASTITGANLFFLNPSGVMFGPHAQVNVTGSFIVGTADYVNLADGGKFNTSLGHDSQLTSAPVSAFGFLSSAPAPVSFTGTQLAMPAGTGLHVIAGDITIDQGSPDGVTQRGSTLAAPSGNLTLFSAASAGQVPFSLASPGSGFASATNPTFGNITIQNKSSVAIDGAGGGNVVIRGGQLVVNNATVSSANSGTVTGGSISVQADQVTVNAGGEIASDTTGTGQGGDVSLTANSLTVDGTNEGSTPTKVSAETDGPGNAGSMDVTVAQDLTILSRGSISTSTTAAGNGGAMTVQAGTMTINGSVAGSSDSVTGLFANAQAGSTGNAGSLQLNVTNLLTMQDEARVAARTFGSGSGGTIDVTAGTLSMTSYSSITAGAETASVTSTAQAGSITTNVTGALSISDGANIETDTLTSGNAGGITVDAGSLSIDGTEAATNASAITGIYSNAGKAASGFLAAATGNAGQVNVNVTGASTITGAGTISTDTFTAGAAGNVSVQSGSLTIDGSADPTLVTGISSNAGSSTWTTQTTQTGPAGSVSVSVTGQVGLMGAGTISTNTYSNGNAGNVGVQAGSILIDGSEDDGISGPTEITGIVSNAGSDTRSSGSGNAGAITVDATDDLTIRDVGSISTSTFSLGNGGKMTVSAGTMTIDGEAGDGTDEITGLFANAVKGSTGSAGSLIDVTITGALDMDGSARIAAKSFSLSNGNAGAIDVTAGSLTMEGPSEIGAGAERNGTGALTSATAGSVTITTTGLVSLSDGSEIDTGTYTNGNAGAVIVNAGSLDITGADGPTTPSGIFSNTSSSSKTAKGNAGSISINLSGAATITGSGSIATNTYTAGNAGTINLQAESLTIDGSATPTVFTGIASNTGTLGSPATNTGNAGYVTVNVTGDLSIVSGGAISASTNTAGIGGVVTVDANTLEIVGLTANNPSTLPTGILAETYGSNHGGSVFVTVNGQLAISNNGGIETSTTSTSAKGNAGNITVEAGSTVIDGNANSVQKSYRSGIISISKTGSSGKAGTIDLTVHGALTVENGSSISVSTNGSGAGGNVTVQADSILIQGLGEGSVNQTGIFADANGLGNAGSVTVNVDDLLSLTDAGLISSSSYSTAAKAGAGGNVTISGQGDIDLTGGSKITASSNNSVAGTIDLTSTGTLTLDTSSSISTASSGASGGNIILDVSHEVYLLDSNITSEANGSLLGTATSGGNITIDPQFIVLNNSSISANDPGGTGGDIRMISDFLFTSSTPITATGTTNGTVTTPAPDLNLAASLLVQPAELEKAEKQLRERCARSLNHEFSSLIVVGRGGIEAAPDELQSDFGTGASVVPAAVSGVRTP